jgi:peptidoglycan/xylan/chitin deacetylase (PgdA/CDA1 family)
MKIYITLDYELYFGANHGTVEKCILYPTSELIRIAESTNVRFVFFVDIGFILKLDEYRKKFPQLEADYKAVAGQVKTLSDTGHDVQLHIHPHWEDSYYNGERWIINVSRYKLADFNEEQVRDIVLRYKAALESITGKKTIAFRAGGWCLQPFTKLEKIFREAGIRVDSSVFRNGYFSSEQYSYDFRNAPDKAIYRFEDDLTAEKKDGYFTELPISPIRNSPLFFWKLFLLGRKDPYLHKPLGDGQAMPAPGYRKKLLTRFTNNPVSVDGYNSHLLQKALNGLQKEKKEHMVVIGHPKALSRYSLQKLEEFIKRNKDKHQFSTFDKTFPG